MPWAQRIRVRLEGMCRTLECDGAGTKPPPSEHDLRWCLCVAWTWPQKVHTRLRQATCNGVCMCRIGKRGRHGPLSARRAYSSSDGTGGRAADAPVLAAGAPARAGEQRAAAAGGQRPCGGGVLRLSYAHLKGCCACCMPVDADVPSREHGITSCATPIKHVGSVLTDIVMT